MGNPATQSLVTIGRLCSLLQRGPGTIESAADSAKIRPVLVINGSRYYSEADIDRIRAALSEGQKR